MGYQPMGYDEILTALGKNVWGKTEITREETTGLSMIIGAVSYWGKLREATKKYVETGEPPEHWPTLVGEVTDHNGLVRYNWD